MLEAFPRAIVIIGVGQILSQTCMASVTDLLELTIIDAKGEGMDTEFNDSVANSCIELEREATVIELTPEECLLIAGGMMRAIGLISIDR